MKLLEALKVLKAPASPGPALKIGLAWGASPLHLKTFLAAHVRTRLAQRGVDVQEGLFGDLTGTVVRFAKETSDAVAVVIEWSDLDPRLSLRSAIPWVDGLGAQVVRDARDRARALGTAIGALGLPVAVCLPTLPLAPFAATAGWEASRVEIQLRAILAELAVQLVENAQVRIVSDHALAATSPPAARLDVGAEWDAGFPYTLTHASAVAELLATNLFPPPRKKGLITDLDDTLWRGILGEVSPQAVLWDIDGNAQGHAHYQKLLASLASTGTLVAVASRNDPRTVKRLFAERSDLIVKKDQFFPIEVSWGQKSRSVERILQAWNVGADSVVFVDDSPMEAAEVKAAFPEIECFVFPTRDEAALHELVLTLRDRFGTSAVTREDQLRLASIRDAVAFRATAEGGDGASFDAFLRSAEAKLTMIHGTRNADPRVLELVNKTNQFNINGRRYLAAEWAERLAAPESVLLVADYLDRFGPLGKIAVLSGRMNGKRFTIDCWVMSCRAFSRRIEHAMLAFLLQKYGPHELVFDFAPTAKNAPAREFLRELIGADPQGKTTVSAATLAEKLPCLHHVVTEVDG